MEGAPEDRSAAWMRAYGLWAIAAFGAVLGLAVLTDFSVTTDEVLRARASIGWWNALRNGDVAQYVQGTRAHYGMAFDQLGRALAELDRALTGTDDAFRARHALCLFTALAGLIATHRLARRLADESVAWVSVALLATTPRFVGSAFANPKDIPFAVAVTFAVWACVRAIQSPSPRSTAWVALAAGLCAAVRPLGSVFFVIGPLCVWTPAVRLDGRYPWRAMAVARRRGAMQALFALLAGYIVVTALWPVLWVRPPWHLATSSVAIARHIRGSQSLFFGEVYPFNDAPGAYVVGWLAVTLPLAIVVPVVPAWVERARYCVTRLRTPQSSLPWLLVLGWVAVPAIVPFVTTVTLYDTCRQLLFMVPACAILAAHGIVAIYRWAALRTSKRRGAKALVFLACTVAVGESSIRIATLHPYQNIYFNPLIGGLQGAHGRFDVAHYSETYADGFAWLAEHAPRPTHVHVLGNGSTTASYYAYRHDLRLNRPTFDYGLSEVRQGWEQVLPGTVIHEISREGVPLLQVRKLAAMQPMQSLLVHDTGTASQPPPLDAPGWTSRSATEGQVFLEDVAQHQTPVWVAIPIDATQAKTAALKLAFYWAATVWWTAPGETPRRVYDAPAVPFQYRATEFFPAMLPLDVPARPGRNWLLVELSRTRLEWGFGVYLPEDSRLRFGETTTSRDH